MGDKIIKIKRVYENPAKEDGYRILVYRLLPRGLSKDKAKINLWMKEIAPTDELRGQFAHDLKRWSGFKNKYKQELKDKPELVQKIKQIEKKEKTVTLRYSAKDEEHNNAAVLSEFLKAR